MLYRPFAVMSFLALAGCTTAQHAAHRSTNVDADIVMSLLESWPENEAFTDAQPAAWYGTIAPGPSLVAGDSIAFRWARAHSGPTEVDIAGWQPTSLETLD